MEEVGVGAGLLRDPINYAKYFESDCAPGKMYVEYESIFMENF